MARRYGPEGLALSEIRDSITDGLALDLCDHIAALEAEEGITISPKAGFSIWFMTDKAELSRLDKPPLPRFEGRDRAVLFALLQHVEEQLHPLPTPTQES